MEEEEEEEEEDDDDKKEEVEEEDKEDKEEEAYTSHIQEVLSLLLGLEEVDGHLAMTVLSVTFFLLSLSLLAVVLSFSLRALAMVTSLQGGLNDFSPARTVSSFKIFLIFGGMLREVLVVTYC